MKNVKKIIAFCLLLFCSFCLIGCSSNKNTNKLTCSKELSNNDGLATYMTSTAEYEGDTIVKVSVKWTAKFDKTKYTEEEMQKLASDTAASYKQTYGNNSNITISNNKINDDEYGVVITVNYKKLSKEERDRYGFNFPDGLEKSKKDFEDSGYVCQ